MLIDLSHTIEHGMTTYPGLPAPLICDYMSREASRAQYAPGVEFHIGRIDIVIMAPETPRPAHTPPEPSDLASRLYLRRL